MRSVLAEVERGRLITYCMKEVPLVGHLLARRQKRPTCRTPACTTLRQSGTSWIQLRLPLALATESTSKVSESLLEFAADPITFHQAAVNCHNDP